MSRSSAQIFGIETVGDYLALCAAAVDELKEQQDSVLKGFTAILALNHLPDWLQYKLTTQEKAQLGFIKEKPHSSMKEFFENQNDDLKLVREIANGFKHVRLGHSTQRVEGYGSGPYSTGPYEASYLLIDLGEDKEPIERWCVLLDLCQRVLAWWQKILLPIIGAEDV